MAATSHSLTFGSFYFAPDTDKPVSISKTEFFQTVERCLRGITGTSAVTVDSGPKVGESPSLEVQPSGDDPQYEFIGPMWDWAHINFELHIAPSVQREFNRSLNAPGLSEEPEDFRIMLGYDWRVPISCVAFEGIGPQAPTAAARAVYLYLKREVERSGEALRFGCIPPIFVHGDFFLSPTNGPLEPTFPRSSYSRPAYHRYEYLFDPAQTPDPVFEFYCDLASEIDLYFQHQEATRQEGRQWVEIEADIDRLTQDLSKSGTTHVLSPLRRGRDINRTAI